MIFDACIIIDMQSALIASHPYNVEVVVENIKQLCSMCRQHNIPIVYIRHDGGANDELEKGSDGWQICSELTVHATEKIIDKQFNSAFRCTNLDEYLQSIDAKRLLMCGMQSEYCVDCTCKVAFEKGYELTIPQDCTTTFDNEFSSGEKLVKYFEENIWNHRYADVIPIDRLLSKIDDSLQ